jgi:hypothetical protein
VIPKPPSMLISHELDVCEMKVRNIQELYSSALKAVLSARNISVSQAIAGMECNSVNGYADAFYFRKLVLSK